MRRTGGHRWVPLLLAAGLAGCALPQSSAAPPQAEPPSAVTAAPTAPAPRSTAPTSTAPAPTAPTPGVTIGAAPTELPAGERTVVTEVVDGDTVRVQGGRSVRIVGIDTPERGQCGFGPAASNLRRLVEGREVVLVSAARTDTDRYDRLLRYVEVAGVDTGREQIAGGHAIARYDSRDGYGRHAREDDYIALDAVTPDPSCGTADVPASVQPYPTQPTQREPAPTPQAFADVPVDVPTYSGEYEPGVAAPDPGGAYYSSCSQARAAGAAPLYAGQPGYRPQLDRDRDGVACE